MAVRVLEAAGSPFFYSTRGADQQVTMRHGVRLTGTLDVEAMTALCQRSGVSLIVDAAHPFAVQLHHTVEEVSELLDLPVVRVEREFPPLEPPCRAFESFESVTAHLLAEAEHRPLRVLALTGVNTISRLRPLWQSPRVECWFRILDREESRQQAASQCFPADHLLFDIPSSSDLSFVMRHSSFDYILTKESGMSGGFAEKVQLAREWGVPLMVVQRPSLPDTWTVVTGEHGLRRAVEMLCPGFFPLRSGFTTGSCATAATVAAAHVLLGHDHPKQVLFYLPDGERMQMPVARTTSGRGWAQASVIKDAGDDPDVTHGTEIVVRISLSPLSSSLSEEGLLRGTVNIHGGPGVGRVTLPGLGLPVGSAAINPVPQQMICDNLHRLLGPLPLSLEVTISVPEGRRLAARTFNSRVGVVDGISIIGTRGIVQPFSAEAFVEAIRREMQVAQAMGISHLVLNSGAKSEAMVREHFPELPPQAFIHYGNFIGDALRVASELGFPHVTLCVMIGKAVKLAAGNLNTHSHQVVMDKVFLTQLAREAGCSPAALTAIASATLARELPESLSPQDFSLFSEALRQECLRTARQAFPQSTLDFILLA